MDQKKKVGPQYCCYFDFLCYFFSQSNIFIFIYFSFKPFIGDHYTTCKKHWWWELVAEDMFHWYIGPSKQSLCMRTVFGHHSLSPILPFLGPKGMYLCHLCSKFRVQTSNHNTGLKFAYNGFLTSTLILACDEVCLHFTCWIWDLCMRATWLDKIIKCFVACPKCGLIA